MTFIDSVVLSFTTFELCGHGPRGGRAWGTAQSALVNNQLVENVLPLVVEILTFYFTRRWGSLNAASFSIQLDVNDDDRGEAWSCQASTAAMLSRGWRPVGQRGEVYTARRASQSLDLLSCWALDLTMSQLTVQFHNAGACLSLCPGTPTTATTTRIAAATPAIAYQQKCV